MIKTRRQAFAQYCGLDHAETEDYRYHAGRTSIPVYAINHTYYCVTKGKQKPASHRDGMGLSWKEVKDDFVNKDGWKIWEAVAK